MNPWLWAKAQHPLPCSSCVPRAFSSLHLLIDLFLFLHHFIPSTSLYLLLSSLFPLFHLILLTYFLYPSVYPFSHITPFLTCFFFFFCILKLLFAVCYQIVSLSRLSYGTYVVSAYTLVFFRIVLQFRYILFLLHVFSSFSCSIYLFLIPPICLSLCFFLIMLFSTFSTLHVFLVFFQPILFFFFSLSLFYSPSLLLLFSFCFYIFLLFYGGVTKRCVSV